MSKFLLLAFRNVFRNRRRTVMTLLMVAGGVAGLLLAGGYFRFMTDGLSESTIRNGLGHIQIFNAEHFKRDEVRVLDTGIDDWRPGGGAGREHAARARRGAPHRVLRHGVERPEIFCFMGSAVDPNAERSLGFTPDLIAGHDLDAKAGDEVGALIGAGLAQIDERESGRRAHAAGGHLRWRAERHRCGDGRHCANRVSGAGCALPAHSAGVRAEAAAERSRDEPGGRSGCDSEHGPRVRRLAPRLSGLPQRMEMRKWIDLATYYKQVRNMFDGIFLFMGIIVFFMVLMSSVNTLLMSMFERTREIGTMLAMGTPQRVDRGPVHGGGGVLGLLGAAIGVVGGNLLGALLNGLNLRLPPPPGTRCGMPFHVLHVPGDHDRRVAAGGGVVGAGVHCARDPRIAAAHYGGIGPCVTSTAFSAGI